MAVIKFMPPLITIRSSKRALTRTYKHAYLIPAQAKAVDAVHSISEERAMAISQGFVDTYESKTKRKRGFSLA